jgi:F-type H+-transporting ATPase subunit alpha
VSVPAQIAVLLALTAELFDPVALDQMTDAEHAVQEAAAKIPTEVCARFETAKKLSDADRKVIIELAHQALAPYEPQPEAKHEGKDGTKSERKPHESMPAARPRTGQMADSEPELKIDPTPALTNAGKPDGKPTTKATPEHST